MIKSQYKAYPKYKPSGVEWIGEIPEGWVNVRFKQFYSFEKGKNAQLYTNEYIQANEGVYPVYSGQTENDGVLGNIDSYIYNLDEEALLITTVGARAMTHTLISGKFSLSQNIALIKKRRQEYHTRFIYYFLFPLIEKERGSIALIMQPSLRFEDLNKYYTFLPPLPEQKAIAAFLDRETERINGIIAKQTRMIELLKEKRSALITQAVTKGLDPKAKMKPSGVEWIEDIPVGWEVRKVKTICRFQYGKSLSDNQRIEDLVPVFGSNGIVGYHNIAITENPCLIIGRKGSFGKVNYSLEKCFPIDTTFFVDTNSTKNDLRWLFYFLTDLKLDEDNQDSAVPGLNREKAYMKLGFLPPLSEQKAIASFLDLETSKIDMMLGKIEKQIELLNEYKQSLITHAVTGKIDVRGEVNAQNS